MTTYKNYTDRNAYNRAMADYQNVLYGGGNYGNTNHTNPMASYPVPRYTGPAATPAPAPAAPVAAPAPAPAAPAGPTAQEIRDAAIKDAVTKGGTYLSGQIADKHYNAADTTDITKRYNDLMGAVSPAAGSTNIPSYYNYGDMFNKAVTAETGEQQAGIQTAFQGMTPYGWQQTAMPDTLDDPVLQQILGEQAGVLQGTLQRNLERGKMSQGAYDYALSQLGYDSNNPGNYQGMAAGAYSNLQGLGGGVLSQDRTGLSDIATDFQNRATNFKLGDVLDPNVFQQNITNKTGEYTGRLRGDIMAALGNTQLFDPNALIAKAGSSVGGAGNTPISGGNAQGSGVLQDEDEMRSVPGTTGTF